MPLFDEKLKSKIKDLPNKPGVYLYMSKDGVVIYVGKAKNLKNRVSSYLNKKNQIGKTILLVNKTEDFNYIVVESEQDALLLENNLIKKYKPKYNILLKDDKSYPWICIKNEPFPRVFSTRNYRSDGSEYFGPYTSSHFVKVLLDLIKSLYKIRTCKNNLDHKNIYSNKFKVCLEYHLGNCAGPCVGKYSQEQYSKNISEIRQILKGNVSSVVDLMKKRMIDFSENLMFEEANEIKSALDKLKNYQSKSTIVSASITDTDVFSYIDDDKYAYINYIRIVSGSVNQVYSVELEKKINEDKEAILAYSILEIRQIVRSKSKTIIVPFYPDIKLENLNYIIPQRGEKKQLLELSERNARYYKMDKARTRVDLSSDKTEIFLDSIRKDLKLSVLPRRIECFDNSNIQGTNPVAACVVFIDGKPAKREYRKFHVKTVEGPDDFASMEEIVFRRYSRMIEEGKDLPNLIVIDGGKGQLHAALNSLEKLKIIGKIPILGLAKRMEEIYFPGQKDPYILAKSSPALKTLMHIRDEAHRFGITFHRKLREKKLVKSELNQIKGIGEKTRELLLKEFKSIEKIKLLNIDELSLVVGNKKAELIIQHFSENAESQ